MNLYDHDVSRIADSLESAGRRQNDKDVEMAQQSAKWSALSIFDELSDEKIASDATGKDPEHVSSPDQGFAPLLDIYKLKSEGVSNNQTVEMDAATPLTELEQLMLNDDLPPRVAVPKPTVFDLFSAQQSAVPFSQPVEKAPMQSERMPFSQPVGQAPMQSERMTYSQPVEKTPMQPERMPFSQPVGQAPMQSERMTYSQPVEKTPMQSERMAYSQPVAKAPMQPERMAFSQPVAKSPTSLPPSGGGGLTSIFDKINGLKPSNKSFPSMDKKSLNIKALFSILAGK
ncbi:MAG: hypothetical protein R8K50_00420 [Mariprofundus sp.]